MARSGYDMSRKNFDLLSARQIRADALFRYETLNQSEPLRINIFLIATVTLLGYPLWCESVTGDLPSIAGQIGSVGLGLGSATLFWRERSRRSSQLSRIEKELNAEQLSLLVPVNTAISDNRPKATLKQLRSKRRIIAVKGSKEQIETSDIFTTLCCFRRRLAQSQTLVVIVPTDSSTVEDWCSNAKSLGSALWLAEASQKDEWLAYFDELDSTSNESNDLVWFVLNFKGRSVASGKREAPRLFELLGQQLQPQELLDEGDEDAIDGESADRILDLQRHFYSTLTSTSEARGMEALFDGSPAGEVQEVVEEGGRIDDWSTCLAEGARPEGMSISGSDVWFESPTLAYSTCVEFPANAGVDDATLLAVQKWVRGGEEDEWKLSLHQTIPWSQSSRAGGTLRCDCRGCTALARSPERRTFGGIIG